MTVTQCDMRFTKLSCHAALLILSEKERYGGLLMVITVSHMRWHERLRLRQPSTSLWRFLGSWSIYVGKREREEREAKNPRGTGGFSGDYSK